MSRTKKHRDLFFLRFLYKLIRKIGSPNTNSRAARWDKVYDRISKSYGGTNWGDNQNLETKYNWKPKHRSMKRADRRKALQQAQEQLDEYRDEMDYLRRVQIQRDWFASFDEPEEDNFDSLGGYLD